MLITHLLSAFPDHIGGYASESNTHQARYDEKIIQVPDHRDPIRDQVEGQERIPDRSTQQDLRLFRRTRVFRYKGIDFEFLP